MLCSQLKVRQQNFISLRFPNQLVKVDSQSPLFLDTESPSQNKNLTNSSKLCDCIFFLHPLHCLQSFLVFNHKAIRKLSYSSLESCVFRRQLKIKSFIFNFKKEQYLVSSTSMFQHNEQKISLKTDQKTTCSTSPSMCSFPTCCPATRMIQSQ